VVGQVSTHWPTRFELLGQFLADIANSSTRHAGAAVGRLVRRELALDARLAAAGDHRGGEAGGATAAWRAHFMGCAR
jgi:hypothetical protein